MPTKTLPSKTLTVRLTGELYSAAQEIARQNQTSLNALLTESLAAAVRAAEEQVRYKEYSLLGEDIESCDVEYAIHAQAEVMLGLEPT
jgi:hypothetical protein